MIARSFPRALPALLFLASSLVTQETISMPKAGASAPAASSAAPAATPSMPISVATPPAATMPTAPVAPSQPALAATGTPPLTAPSAPAALVPSKQQEELLEKIRSEVDALYKLKHEARAMLQEFDDKLSTMRENCAHAKKTSFDLLSTEQEQDARAAYDSIQKALSELQTMQEQTQGQFSRALSEKLGMMRTQTAVAKASIESFLALKKEVTPTATTSTVPAVQTPAIPLGTAAPTAPATAQTQPAASSSHGGIVGFLGSCSAGVINGVRAVYQWFASPSPSTAPTHVATPTAPRQPIPAPANKVAATQETLRLIDQANQDVKAIDNGRILLQREFDSVMELLDSVEQLMKHDTTLALILAAAARAMPLVEPSWKKTVVHVFSRTLDGLIFVSQRVIGAIHAGLEYAFGKTLGAFWRDVKTKTGATVS